MKTVVSDGNADTEAAISRIMGKKRQMGSELVILTHHYQRKEIVDLGDFQGDSFALARKAAADQTARYIVFCGVHFMAESAAILAQPRQTVQIPDVEAGCWMADMADSQLVTDAWQEVAAVTGDDIFTPIVYMNSDAHIKAFCGRHGGIVCTSSNAPAAFEWAFSQREKIFFFPDQHLGRNTGNRLGIPADRMILWQPGRPLGGNTAEQVARCKVILWDGYCLVHTRFTTDHVQAARQRYPEAKIVVHPECTQEVVALADAVGSTSYMVNYIEQAPAGATVVVGTEINLIERLARDHGDKTIVELHRSLCPNMFKIDAPKLLDTLENIGRKNVITVDEEIKAESMVALGRMLALPH